MLTENRRDIRIRDFFDPSKAEERTTIPRVARALRINPQTAYRWNREGVLASENINGRVRIKFSAVAELIERTGLGRCAAA